MDGNARRSLHLIHVMTPLLDIQNLHVVYHSRTGETIPALTDVSFDLRANEILGVLGESASGKTTLASALLGLLPPNGEITKGAVLLEGQDVRQASPQELERIRGGRISLIFQEPSVALHPAMRVGDQVAEVLRAHESLDSVTLRNRTRKVLAGLFPSETERIAQSYPHQLSGGQRQRILIAQAIACGPALVVADEPTASLDPTTRAETLSLFNSLRHNLGLAMILITHNPALLAGLADRVLVLYAGRVAEWGPANSVLSFPQHPYTRALLRCLPQDMTESKVLRKTKLPAIPGDSPRLSVAVKGCAFELRCPDRMECCGKREPPLIPLNDAHAVSCFKFGG
jgi:oligopeptide/dipeptide ABC transporter ATP-binding protein